MNISYTEASVLGKILPQPQFDTDFGWTAIIEMKCTKAIPLQLGHWGFLSCGIEYCWDSTNAVDGTI
jgi:hypothetical protein